MPRAPHARPTSRPNSRPNSRPTSPSCKQGPPCPAAVNLSAVPKSNAHAPSLVVLQHAARRLMGESKALGRALFAPIEGPDQTCAVYMRQVHDNDHNLTDVELVMRYIFTVGDRAGWALGGGLPLEHGPILQNIVLCGSGYEDDDDGTGALPRNVDRFTAHGRCVCVLPFPPHPQCPCTR